jgi:hypothetical protein
MTKIAQVGFWAAIGTCAASIAYGVAQLLQFFGLLGDPVDRIAIFVPSLILVPFFVATLAAAHDAATAAARGWRAAALALALLYGGMVSLVYVNQLGVVIPGEKIGLYDYVRPWTCCAFQEPMTAVDLLGYTYMSLALLLLAPSYPRGLLRWLLIANGLLAPVILLQLYWPILILPAAAWLVLFPAAIALIAREFRAGGEHVRPRMRQRRRAV